MKRVIPTPKAKSAPMSRGPIWNTLDHLDRTEVIKTVLDGTDWAHLFFELATHVGTSSQFDLSDSQIKMRFDPNKVYVATVFSRQNGHKETEVFG